MGIREREVKFPNVLAKYREQRGLTPTEIAVEIGVSHTTVYGWESGTIMPRQKRILLPLIEKAYGASRADLWPTVFGQ